MHNQNKLEMLRGILTTNFYYLLGYIYMLYIIRFLTLIVQVF